MTTKGLNDRILFIPDEHRPFQHPDADDFLEAVDGFYKPTRVVRAGDELDLQAMKFHPRNPNLPSPGDEMEAGIAALQRPYKLHPKCDILHSNHTSLAYRQAAQASISNHWLRSYREALEAPTGWRWHKRLILTSGNTRIMFAHGISPQALRVAIKNGICYAQGHFHSRFAIEYSASHQNLVWGLNGGCLIDLNNPAFEFGDSHLNRSILGCSTITMGMPQLIPMRLDRHGRWVGKL